MIVPKAFLKQNRKKRLEQGHPWVFPSEIEKIEGNPQGGDIVHIVNHVGHFLAQGFYNPLSQLILRVVSYSEDDVDESLFYSKIEQAWKRRQWLVPEATSCRVVHGEADFLPGLIIDKYEDVLVVQILSLGIEMRRQWIYQALIKLFNPLGIFERSDVSVRRLEGLEERMGFVDQPFETKVTVRENGLSILVDVAEGQKTGYFFDQRENRAALKPLMTGWGAGRGIKVDSNGLPIDPKGKAIKNPFWDGAEVLDCFSHTGSFMLHACQYGAKKVTCLDISEKAIEMAKSNALLNGFLHRTEFIAANAFDFLREQVKDKKTWDVVILDPPAFAKNRQAIEGALRGYKEINLQGMKLVRNGGILVTASCSYHLSAARFLTMLQEAAADAHKVLRLIEFRRAGADHPVLLGSEETDYLKFAMYEVFNR
ncbi:class I SAM-dependent rRNA methyltransferase [Desulfosporosinus sp. BICA1-9]|uniref:class I SAM-dependent rRNA methyltransferase n=1 Tax=Desulfosporosinus sp. BICA1-9 TaxID=1531958 RepID=UPI0006201AA3|nr:class I SAM-dependent rRNA methyltransferase [Desulfosporosinus sp. BICA1-9]KJS49080.1 MAG: SAM-dependent methyltransferase [Peptococcaceae bacterium BRH_c23]HBW36682.1 rRNA large subunit methyltransferase I [Desulfosporosinus sp.]